jgi:hypothetical protein
MKTLLFCLFFLLFFAPNSFAQSTRLVDKSVRFVYLVSKDRSYNPEYAKAIEAGAIDVQAWYKKQLNGFTFKINSPVVEVAYSDKDAAYFYGKGKPSAGFFVVLEEVNRLLKARQSDPNYIWVIYSDAPDHSGMGGGGVCIMPENDLIGLIGKSTKYPDIKRWYGGLGHEIGHAFGLPHPSDTKKHEDAIMWTGMYFKYPNECYLTPEDKVILNKSPFFFDENNVPISKVSTNDVSVSDELNPLVEYVYSRGYFTRLQNTQTREITWIEETDEGNSFRFTELKTNAKFYHLKSINRNIEIRIPFEGGQSQMSINGGQTWRNFQLMEKVPVENEGDSMRFGTLKKNQEKVIEPIE